MRSTSRGWSVPGEPLTESQINQIAFAVRDGTAKPQDAKRLMAHFCELVEHRKPLPPRLLEHFRATFRAYLDGTKKLEAALGVVARGDGPRGTRSSARRWPPKFCGNVWRARPTSKRFYTP
jgi:hypothetical protein